MNASITEAPRVAGWPILGVLVPMTRQGPIEFFSRAWQRHGDIFRARLGPRDVVVLAHPDAIEHVLATNRENYVKGMSYRNLRVLTGDGLITIEGDVWRRRRRLEQPAFHREGIRQLIGTMVDVARSYFEDLERRAPDDGVVDAHREMLRFTLDVVGATLFGQSLSLSATRAFGTALELLSDRGNVPVALPLSVPTPGNVRLKRALALLDEMIYGIIRRARESDGPKPRLLGMLMAARDADTGEALSDRELRDEAITMVLAGHETTALVLTWGFAILGRHPEVVQRMRAEVERVLGDREPAAEDLPNLVYVRQVIDEIMRVRPPVWTVARDVVADDVVCGHRVRAGETVMPMQFLVHRHPGFWEEPERFDPDRFRPERAKGRHHYAYMPFSLGPRICIGNTFALSELQIFFAMMLQRIDFRLTSMREPPMRTQMTLRPGGPVNVRVRWRRRSRVG